MQHRQLGTPSPLPATAQGGVGLGQPGARAHSEPGERVGRCLGAYWRSDVADRLRACRQWRAASCARHPSTRRLPTCPPSHPWCRWGARRRCWPAASPGHSASPLLLWYRGAGGARGAARPAAAHDVHGFLARPSRALHRHRAVRAQRRKGLAAFAGAGRCLCGCGERRRRRAALSPAPGPAPRAANPTTAAAHPGRAFTLGSHYIAEVRPPPAPPPAPPARFGAAAWAARHGPPSPRRRLAFGRQRRSAPAPRPPAWPSRLAPCCHSIPPYPSPPLPPSGGHRAAGGHAAAGGARHRCGAQPLRRRQGGGRRELSCWLVAGAA